MEQITLVDSFVRTVSVAGDALIDALVLFAVMYVAQLFYRATYFFPSQSRFKDLEKGKSVRANFDEEVVGKRKFALAISLAGYLIGIAIASTGMLDPDFPWKAGGILERVMMMFSVGLVATAFMRLSLVINDRFILSKFCNAKEIASNNIGVACVEAGGCIATGFIVSGALTTKADSIQDQFGYGLAYWFMGQVALVVGTHCYRLICGYDLDGSIKYEYPPSPCIVDTDGVARRSLSAGLAFGGFLVAIGLIVQTALTKAGTGSFSMEDVQGILLPEAATVLVFVGVGMLLLMASKLLLNKLLFPVVSKETGNGNVGSGVLAAAVSICIGFLYASSVWIATINASAAKPEPASPPVIAAPAHAAPVPTVQEKEPPVAPAPVDKKVGDKTERCSDAADYGEV